MTHQFSSASGANWRTWIGALDLDGAASPAGSSTPQASDSRRDRLDCVCAFGLQSDRCGGATIPGAMLRGFERFCEKGRRALAAKPRKASRLRRRASDILFEVQRRLVRAELRGRLPAACAQALRESLPRLRTAVGGGKAEFFRVVSRATTGEVN